MSNGFGSPSPIEQRSSKHKGLQSAVDAQQVQQQWLSQFKELEDPRGLQGQEHAFVSIVLIAILATIGGATGWEDIELYAESHQAWAREFSGFKSRHSPC
jgi:PIN domain nuclease of toxin-antitoxin system